jgi:hypothetical protein
MNKKWSGRYHRISFHLQPRKISIPVRVTSGSIISIWLLPSNQAASSFPHLAFRVMLLHGGQDEMGAKLRFGSLTYLTFPSKFLFIADSSVCLWSLSGIPRCLTKGLCHCSMAPYDTERCDRQWIPLHRWRATKLTWKEEDRINTLIARASALYLIQQGLTFIKYVENCQIKEDGRQHVAHLRGWNMYTYIFFRKTLSWRDH